MCGIAGTVYRDASRPVDRRILAGMARSIAHRGPDAEGFHVDRHVGLAHRRLSIIDVQGGRQPMSSEDDLIQVVFNGEIYNFPDLRRDLESRGHRFRTASDTEVIVHAYEEFGDDCVQRLRGMFAFAVWDSRRRRLLLARDRVGIKPLYFSLDHQRLVFGSELKAVLAHGDVAREVDASAVDEFLAGGVISGSRSIFRQVEKLLPAETLSIEVDTWNVKRRRYWRLEFVADETMSCTDWQEQLADRLKLTVRDHLLSDVPVGAFLSGGLDSSVVTGLAAAAMPTPIQTFSIGFREARFSELKAAAEVAAHFGTEHIEQIVEPDAAELLPSLARFYDEPFADSSALPTFLVSQLASRHVKVVLSGDGGDEALGGYARYRHDIREAAVRRLIPAWMRQPWLAAVARFWPRADWLPRPLRLKSALTNLSLSDADGYANTLSLCRMPERSRLLHPDVRRQVQGRAMRRAADAYRAAGTGDPLSGMIAADMATLLPDDYLVKVDRASMACGLEVRPPMLDHEFLELCARIPSRWKVRNGETKWLLRRTAASLLPSSILDRPKQGFEIPVDAWLRGPLQEMFRAHVLAPASPVEPFIDRNEAARLYESHLRGTGRHGSTLWSLLALSVWADQYLQTTDGGEADGGDDAANVPSRVVLSSTPESSVSEHAGVPS